MQVHVDQDRCCGSGMCVLTAGAVFDQRDADGIVVLLAEHPAKQDWDDVREAESSCPSQAITVEEDQAAG
ncbi:Ferredoxin [Actinacidiphila yanglinensis]|uniref:Ferredoxin n=1 Tax=Actinacidiphila yanglinensis TaxID=310779 RepID=A0A1H6DQY0_9ACTN|nr:ferredoxin [Actinacidiphila yanglinensis]SEG87709.1 Ferredoxin [Actinacidiphila yanglinensis]